ncbi:MAG: acetyl-CoA carboxylase biotin carboxyl carrier protein [Lentisphaeraceae bacterium]|nr:acetyl-CoA carboxylase biotin carboxyl carrier protein [Lentisphaeraceae bacterium]
MDLEKIKQVIDLMNDNKLTEFSYEEHNKYKLVLKQGSNAPTIIAAPSAAPAAATAAPVDPSIKIIESPLVGTFYSKPSPEAPEFVKVGDEIKEGSVLCIVEAMKVMNEITAEFDHVISEILVSDGEAVEYGQPLFKVKVK